MKYVVVITLLVGLFSCGRTYKKAVCRRVNDGGTLILWVPAEAKIGDTVLPGGLDNLYIVIPPEIKYQ